MSLIDKEPELRDEVKSKIAQDIIGTVITKYPDKITGEQMLDIRLSDETIWYNTLATNWEVIRLNDE